MIPDLRPDAVVLSGDLSQRARYGEFQRARAFVSVATQTAPVHVIPGNHDVQWWTDRKSTRLNSSHGYISYAVFCLKKKKNTQEQILNRHAETERGQIAQHHDHDI